MFYQIAQLSFSGLLLMIQVLFLYLIRRRKNTSTQVFSEPQQLSQYARRDTPRKSSTIITGTMRRSVGVVRKSTIRIEEDPQSNGVNSNHYIKTVMKEQRIQRKKSMREESTQRQRIIESPDGTLLHVQLPVGQSSTPQTNTQLPDLPSDRDPLSDLFGDTKKAQSDLLVFFAFFLQRLGLEQGLLLLLYNQEISYYIYIPVCLASGVILRVQERFGFTLASMGVTMVIHSLGVVCQALLESDEFETMCYLVILGVECIFSIISYILLKKCK